MLSHTADYVGTVSRIVLDRTRYVAIFEGGPIEPVKVTEPVAEAVEEAVTQAPTQFPWQYVLIPVGAIALAGAGIGVALSLKRRSEYEAGQQEEGAV